MERKHFNDYDLLRIIAIVFVVLGHSAWIDSAGEYGALHYQLPENLASAYNGWLMTAQRYLVGWVYGFHMPLFFILSGAVYGISDRYNFDILCWKKIMRLFIPFWIYSLGFTIPLMWLGNFYDNSTVIVAYVNALGGGVSHHLWFLLALFWVFVVFWFVQRIALGSLCALFLLSLLVQFYHSSLPFDFFRFQIGMGYFIWFCLGYIFQKLRSRIYVTRLGSIALLYIMTFAMIIETKYLSGSTAARILVRSAWIYSVCVFILKFVPSLAKNRPYKILLRNCFYIYIFHAPFEHVILRFAFEFNWLTSDIGCYVYALLRTVGVIIVSILMGETVVWLKKNWAGLRGLMVRT